MRKARVESFIGERQQVLISVEFDGTTRLTGYEADHLGDIVVAYLSAIGFDQVVGSKSVRVHLSDEELESEIDDFTVLREGRRTHHEVTRTDTEPKTARVELRVVPWRKRRAD